MNRKFSPAQEQEIIRLYVDDRVTVADLIARFGGSSTSIGGVLRRSNVEIRTARGKFLSVRERHEILRRYSDGEPIRSLAKRYGLRTGTLTNVLEEQGAKIKPGGKRKSVTEHEEKSIAVQYQNGLPLKKLAETYDTSVTTIRNILARQDTMTRPGGNPYSGAEHPQWRGGRRMVEGYCYIKVSTEDLTFCVPNSSGYVAEHRLVMGKSLGRPLSSRETVHHINGDRADNRLENLQLRQGHHGSGVIMKCNSCGSHDISAASLE